MIRLLAALALLACAASHTFKQAWKNPKTGAVITCTTAVCNDKALRSKLIQANPAPKLVKRAATPKTPYRK